jgi:hypothetical protein
MQRRFDQSGANGMRFYWLLLLHVTREQEMRSGEPRCSRPLRFSARTALYEAEWQTARKSGAAKQKQSAESRKR